MVKEYGEIPDIEVLPQQINQAFMNILINAAEFMDQPGTITIRTRMEERESKLRLPIPAKVFRLKH